jgi:hypothetical protein
MRLKIILALTFRLFFATSAAGQIAERVAAHTIGPEASVGH